MPKASSRAGSADSTPPKSAAPAASGKKAVDSPFIQSRGLFTAADAPTVAVDAMGGDFGPSVVVPGVLAAAVETGARLVLVGDAQKIEAEVKKFGRGESQVEIVHSTQVAEMDDKPTDVIRRKKDSSIAVCCRLVAEGRAAGVVSAGNTGVSLACGMFGMGRAPGVERPALSAVMFTEKSPMVLIDVGANVDCKPHHLLQFGVMGDMLAKDVIGFEKPRVGILSIGEEEGKGNSQVKAAFDLLKKTSLNFVGNVEGRDIFTGEVDVVVCDGFVGNVVLKVSEGLGMSLLRILKKELRRDVKTRVGASLVKGALANFKKLIDYSEYGGAPLLGLNGILIVCHGASNAKAMGRAVDMASTFIFKKTNERLIAALAGNEELSRYGSTAAKT